MQIFFDVDGVLINGWHANSALRRPWDVTIEADLGVSRESFQELFFGTAAPHSTSPMSDCVVGRRDLADALAEVLPKIGYQGRIEDFMRYWFEKDSNVNADMFRLVEHIRAASGAKVYIATGQEHYRARYLWNELGFSKHFNDMFYSAEIGYSKRDVRFFEAVNCSLNIGIEQRPLFFDDQSEIIELAKSAGWDGTPFTSITDVREHPRLRHLWPKAAPIAPFDT
jgi:putative hydrolase of the HAD superfamily